MAFYISLQLCAEFREVLRDIEKEDALDIKRESDQFESGFQTAYDPDQCKWAMENTGQYQCGANFFAVSLKHPAIKGVPYRREGVRQLEKFWWAALRAEVFDALA